MNRDELLKCLSALDFVAVDLGLYLDTHPTDDDAICKYNETLAEAEKYRELYEEAYGPLCSFRSPSRKTWTWINNPWPWNEEANCNMTQIL